MIKNIILDFGHGGIDENGNYTTAPSKMYKFENGEIAYEGVLNRQIGGYLYTYLKDNTNLNILCTVKEDDPTDISLQQRVRFINQYTAYETLFVSIHCNAGKGSGFEIFTTKGTTNSDKLAECIADEIEILYKELNLKLRYDFSDGDKDKEENFFVLRNTYCPAVLIECLFFDNYEDYKFLKDPNFQTKCAFHIYKGILKYINK